MSDVVHAQKIIKGMVVDSVSLNALPNVHVKIKNTNRGTVTNPNGLFALQLEPFDTLIFSTVGYAKIEIPVYIMDEVMMVTMREEATMLKEVTIRYRNSIAKKQEMPSLVLRPQKALPFSGATPNSGFGTSINLDYFSKAQKERRKLGKVMVEYELTKQYIGIISDPDIKQQILDRFSLPDSVYYKLLVRYNQEHVNEIHSANSGVILNSLFYFFEHESAILKEKR